MAFLSINGYEILVANDSVDVSYEEIGGSKQRAHDGTLLSSRRTTKRQWTATTPPMTYANAVAVEGLLLGLGHHLSFDDATYWQYTSKGLYRGSVNNTPSRGTATPSPKFGAGYLQNDANDIIYFTVAASTAPCIMAWLYNGATWDHYIKLLDGTVYKNGSTSGSPTATWLTSLANGSTTIGDSSARNIDDVVILPYTVNSGMITAFSAATSAFSDLPRLTLTGDLVGSESVTVEGSEVKVKKVQGVIGGAWTDNARVVSFSLLEA